MEQGIDTEHPRSMGEKQRGVGKKEAKGKKG